MALAYYDVGAGHFDQPATSRFCALSRSENRTKLEFNQHCMDSMTSLRYYTAHARSPIHSPFFFGGWVRTPTIKAIRGIKFNFAQCFLHCPISYGLQCHKILLNRYNNTGYFH